MRNPTRIILSSMLTTGLLVTFFVATAALAQTTPKALQSDNYTTAREKGGVVLGSDHVSGIHYPRQKPVYGPYASVTDVSLATPPPTLACRAFVLSTACCAVLGLVSIIQ